MTTKEERDAELKASFWADPEFVQKTKEGLEALDRGDRISLDELRADVKNQELRAWAAGMVDCPCAVGPPADMCAPCCASWKHINQCSNECRCNGTGQVPRFPSLVRECPNRVAPNRCEWMTSTGIRFGMIGRTDCPSCHGTLWIPDITVGKLLEILLKAPANKGAIFIAIKDGSYWVDMEEGDTLEDALLRALEAQS